MSTRPTAYVLGADDESDLQQTLGDSGGMGASVSTGLFGALAGENTPGEPKTATTPTKLRSTGGTASSAPTATTRSSRSGVI